MGIETEYEYIYYTVINTEDWSHGNEEWFDDGFTWENAIDFIDHKLKTSPNESVNNYTVDYAEYCDDIAGWKRQWMETEVVTVFVQFQDNQPIKTIGQGDLFVLCEKNDSVDLDNEHLISSDCPDVTPQMDSGIDGLAFAGGRL